MSKKILRLVFITFLVSLFLFILPKVSQAYSCTFTYYPDPPNQNMKDLRINISTNDLPDGVYWIRVQGPKETDFWDKKDVNLVSGNASGTVTTPIYFPTGDYNVYFIPQSKAGSGLPKNLADCTNSFKIQDIPASSCTATINTKPIDPNTTVAMTVDGITSANYDIYINDEKKLYKKISSGDTIDLGTFYVGQYIVKIKNECGPGGLNCLNNPPRTQCNPACFTVAPSGSGEGGQCQGSVILNPCSTDPKKCSSAGGFKTEETKECIDNKDHPGIVTAIGCIHTNPSEFAQDLLKFIIGIGGGVAFLMMLLGAFQMLTSAGNPDTLRAGRERLTSAVIGLLIVIFAVLLLQIIGIRILAIPGFGP